MSTNACRFVGVPVGWIEVAVPESSGRPTVCTDPVAMDKREMRYVPTCPIDGWRGLLVFHGVDRMTNILEWDEVGSRRPPVDATNDPAMAQNDQVEVVAQLVTCDDRKSLSRSEEEVNLSWWTG